MPNLQDAMIKKSYTFIRRFMYFSDNSLRKTKITKGTKGYEPLFRVKYLLEVAMKGMQLSWNAGKHVTVDESMIQKLLLY